MTPPPCSDPRLGDLLGAYLLDACENQQRDKVAAHVASCEACGEAARRWAPAREALLTEVPPAAPGEHVRDRLMRQVRVEAELFRAARPDAPAHRAPRARRPWRRGLRTEARRPLALVLAGSIVALAVAAGLSRHVGNTGREQVVAAEVRGGSGALRVVRERASLELRGLGDPGRGRVYQVWLARDGHAPEPTDALFTVRAGGRAEVGVPRDVRRYDHVLVTSEPAGGSEAPTRSPVVSADVPRM